MQKLTSFDEEFTFHISEDDIERMVNFMDDGPKTVSKLDEISENFSLMERDRKVFYELTIIRGNELKDLMFDGYFRPNIQISYAERRCKTVTLPFSFKQPPGIVSGHLTPDRSSINWFIATFSRELVYSSLKTRIFYDFSPTQAQPVNFLGYRESFVVNKSDFEFDVIITALDKNQLPITAVTEGPGGILIPEMKAVRLEILKGTKYEVIGYYGGPNFPQTDFKSICLDHNHIPLHLLFQSPIFYDRSLRTFRQFGVKR